MSTKMLRRSFVTAGHDYIAVGHLVRFPAGSTVQTLEVIILDDYGSPVLEFAETFQLVLKAAVNGSLGSPHAATVTINDTLSDRTHFYFHIQRKVRITFLFPA